MIFLICLEELHSLEAPTSFVFQLQLEGGSNPLVSQATTRGKLQLPKYLATTRRRLQPPKFFSYNQKVATTTCPCPVQPPWSRSRMMEPLSQNHCEIYRCKPVPINLNHASTMHQPIPKPVINLYHKQVHPTMYQVCTNHVSTTHQLWLINMYQHHQLYTSCMCQLINYLSQPCTQLVPQPKYIINFIIQIWFVTL